MGHTPWSKHVVARMRLEGAIADLKEHIFFPKNEPCLIFMLVDVQADARRWIVGGFDQSVSTSRLLASCYKVRQPPRTSILSPLRYAPIEVVETESTRLQGKTTTLYAPATFGGIPCTGSGFWIAALVK